MIDTRDLLDEDGENKAVRTFLMFYAGGKPTFGNIKAGLKHSGWNNCWPDWVNEQHPDSYVTKAGAQLWLRFLFSLEVNHENNPGSSRGASAICMCDSSHLHDSC